jgi:hypothetical protein
MATLDSRELRSLGDRLKRQTTNRDVLAYIDGTMPIIGLTVSSSDVQTCPVCEARKKAKAAAQRKWWRKAKGRKK